MISNKHLNKQLTRSQLFSQSVIHSHQEMHLIGVTGGIATGKSTVSDFIARNGFTVLDGDLIAREVVQPGMPALEKMKQAFGQDVILPDGSLDRQAVGDMIFNDEEKRRILNAIVHPAIYRMFFVKCLQCLWKREQLVFLDLPLLFESGSMIPFLSKIIVVSCSEQVQQERLMRRNNLSIQDARARISSQMSLSDKRNRADIVIDNSLTIESTREQVEESICSLKKQLVPSWRYYFLDGILVSLGSLCGWVIGLWF